MSKTKLKPITVYLQPEVYNLLASMAVKDERSVSQAAAILIREGVERSNDGKS